MRLEFAYRSFAKINLYLDVLQRRRDGYHNIETIFQTVSLHDEITVRREPSGISLECSLPELECGEDNLAYRAAKLLHSATGGSASGPTHANRGVHIQLRKHIPLAAGLAGGSGNAAATLVAVNRLWELNLSRGTLSRLALELGSDVPYCLVGGTMVGVQRGEELTPIDPLPRTWFILVHPAIGISASRVYNSPNLVRNAAARFAGRTRGLRYAVQALRRGDFAAAVFNGMERPVFSDYPHLAKIKTRLLDAGCMAACMSGSGSTMLGVVESREKAEKVAVALSEFRTSIVSSAPCGVEAIA